MKSYLIQQNTEYQAMHNRKIKDLNLPILYLGNPHNLFEYEEHKIYLFTNHHLDQRKGRVRPVDDYLPDS